ncbi:MAG: Holliday junction resolvase RuvX [Lautropia sp.]|nr:Holliday junction resolvase RuvX [Lautropia sp.]
MNTPVQTLLGFDFGQKRIGVAVGNTLTGAARPLVTLTEATVDGRFARIEALLREWQPSALVVGRPLHPDGAEHEVTALAERFARQLQGRFGLPVSLVDERYSTVAAQARLREGVSWAGEGHGGGDDDGTGVGRGGRRVRRGAPAGGRGARGSGRGSEGDDAAAAAIILEQYLNGSG